MQARSTPSAGHTARTARRGLSTARAALQVAWLLAARPEGVRADEVAETLGRSVSTAYNLLASLCEEGVAEHHPGGLYRLTPGFRDVVATGVTRPAELHDLSAVADDLLARTHKRSYVGLLRGGELHVVLERGLQGMPKLPGMSPDIRDAYHDNARVLGIFPVAAYNGGPRNVGKLYKVIKRMRLALEDLRPAGDESADGTVICPCLWKAENDLVLPVAIPRYNNENRWYIEKYQTILRVFE